MNLSVGGKNIYQFEKAKSEADIKIICKGIVEMYSRDIEKLKYINLLVVPLYERNGKSLLFNDSFSRDITIIEDLKFPQKSQYRWMQDYARSFTIWKDTKAFQFKAKRIRGYF